MRRDLNRIPRQVVTNEVLKRCGVDALRTAVIFLISFVILPLTVEAACAVDAGKRRELVAQNGGFPARVVGGGMKS